MVNLIHSSQFQSLCSIQSSSKMHQNLSHFIYTKTQSCLFHFVLLYFFPYECPGLCQHRPRAFIIGKKIKLLEMKNEKKLRRFSYYKNIANFEAFWGDKNFSNNILFLGSVDM